MQMLKEIAWHRLDELVPACDEMITRSVNGLKLYMVAPFLKLVYFPVLILNVLLSIIFFVCLSFFCVPDVYDMNDVIIHFQYFLFCGGIPSFVFFLVFTLLLHLFRPLQTWLSTEPALIARKSDPPVKGMLFFYFSLDGL